MNRTMIKASGFRKIADLFKLVPGMYVGYMNGYTPIVSYRGATDEFCAPDAGAGRRVFGMPGAV